MKKYPLLNNGNTFYASYIGVNHTAINTVISNHASSYDKEFDNSDYVCIESGIGEIRHCTIGDISEAYKILKNEIVTKNPQNLEEYCVCVEETVLKYFGDFTNVKDRLSYFPSEEDIELFGIKMGCISDIAHKNAAMCIERAMLSHNLLLEIGIKSIFKASGVILNGKPDAHAYNLINHDGKYYLFDATIPTVRNDQISPLICEIPKEVFDKISRPESEYGISIPVSHYNPLQSRDYEITYDAKRSETYTPDIYKKVI